MLQLLLHSFFILLEKDEDGRDPIPGQGWVQGTGAEGKNRKKLEGKHRSGFARHACFSYHYIIEEREKG